MGREGRVAIRTGERVRRPPAPPSQSTPAHHRVEPRMLHQQHSVGANRFKKLAHPHKSHLRAWARVGRVGGGGGSGAWRAGGMRCAARLGALPPLPPSLPPSLLARPLARARLGRVLGLDVLKEGRERHTLATPALAACLARRACCCCLPLLLGGGHPQGKPHVQLRVAKTGLGVSG